MTDEQKKSTIEFAYAAAKDFGIPVLILGVLLWFLRDAAVATHHTVIEPVVKAHLEFLQDTRDTLKDIGDAQVQQVRTMQEIGASQRDLQVLIGRMHGVPVSAQSAPDGDQPN